MKKNELIKNINEIVSELSFIALSCLNFLNIQYDNDRNMAYVRMCFLNKADEFKDIDKLSVTELKTIYEDLARDFK